MYKSVHNAVEQIKPVRCKECGHKACICSDGINKWAAHCMECDNTIGCRGYYDPCAKSEEEAIRLWNELNTKGGKENE